MTSADHSDLRKRLLEPRHTRGTGEPSHVNEIDLPSSATIHYSSEDPAHPVEHLFDGNSGRGGTCWRGAHPNVTEEILIEFDAPQHVAHCSYEVEEADRERTQEVRVQFSSDHGQSFRQVLVQEYTFSPAGATYQCETLSLDLREVTHLRLIIVPHKSGSGTATLTSLRLFT